jgi:hypothetical protein
MWKQAWNDPSFRKQLLFSTTLLAAVLALLFFVLAFAEQRSGFVIEEGWLDWYGASGNYSTAIFSCTYSAVWFGLIFTLGDPKRTLLLIRVYLLVQLLRAIILFLVPLDPPNGIVPLDDPFLRLTFYNGRPNLKDLFFSGHVATLLMFCFILPRRWQKNVMLLLALAAGLLLVLQRVHYAIDVAAAPAFAFLAVFIARRWTGRSSSSSSAASSTTIS